MAANPAFASTPHTSQVRISTANTARDGTGTLGTLFAAAATGSRVDRVVMNGTGASTTSGMLRLFVSDGTNIRLLREFPVSAATPSATVQGWFNEYARTDGFPIAVLQSGWSLLIGTHNAEQFDVVAHGGDF
jgi:hypothetical protein